MQDDFQHATPEGSSGKGIYQDNGSGGWKQTENVIDGAWNRFYNIDNPEGPYGIGRECPGEVASEPFDNCTNTTSGADRSKVLACSCQLIFTHNFVRTYNNRGSGSDEQPHIGGNCLTFANWGEREQGQLHVAAGGCEPNHRRGRAAPEDSENEAVTCEIAVNVTTCIRHSTSKQLACDPSLQLRYFGQWSSILSMSIESMWSGSSGSCNFPSTCRTATHSQHL